MSKKESKTRLVRWVLFLQEFDLTIADHLSRIVQEEAIHLRENYPNEHLFQVNDPPAW